MVDDVRMGFLGTIPVGALYTGELEVLKKGRGDGQIGTKKHRARMEEFRFLSFVEYHFSGHPRQLWRLVKKGV